MAPRGSIVATLLVISLLAFAGAVDAKSGNAQAPPASPPEHAKAQGLAKHAEPEPAPAPTTPEPEPTIAQGPTPSSPAAEAPPAAASASAPAAAPMYDITHTPSESAPASHPPLSFAPASILTAPTNEERIDARTATFGGGAATTRAPSWAGDALHAPSGSSDAPAPWWIHLAWALPVAGIGGVAAVLVARHRRPTPAMAPRGVRMVPVSPDDLQGLLQNGHGAVARGAYAEAVAWFERALAVHPKLGVAYFCKGVCLAATGQVADAYGALRTACTVEPGDANYRVHFARVAVALGKHKEAMDSLQLVASAMPELGPAMLEDPQLAGLRDHPRFLMICGAL